MRKHFVILRGPSRESLFTAARLIEPVPLTLVLASAPDIGGSQIILGEPFEKRVIVGDITLYGSSLAFDGFIVGGEKIECVRYSPLTKEGAARI